MNKIVSFLNYFFHIIYLFHKNRIVRYLNKQKKNIKVVFDVGAYRGKFGNSFKKSKVFFFESNPHLFKKIKKRSGRYFNVGIGAKHETKKFYIMPNDSTSSFKKINYRSRFREKFFNYIEMVIIEKKIKIFPLNYFIKKYNVKNIDILKIDTEGFEEEVLNGINNKNFKKIKYIVIEKLSKKNLYKKYSFKRIEKILVKNNFFLIKKFKDFLWNYEDLVFKNKNVQE